MKTYEKPLMIMEQFIPNQVIASSCEPGKVTFTCFRGPRDDDRNVLTESPCNPIVTMITGVSKAKSSYKTKDFGNVDGLVYYCTKTQGTGISFDQWELKDCVLTHKTSGNKDTHDDNWHCMVAGVTNASTVSTS